MTKNTSEADFASCIKRITYVESGISWILEGRMPRRLESLMTSSPMTRLNISFTHSLKSWMGKTGMSGFLSQYPGLVSNEFANIDKVKKRIKYNN